MSSEFFRTGMGQKYYEHTRPGLMREMGNLRAAIAELTQTIAQQAQRSESAARRVVLVVHRDAGLLRAMHNSFSPEHEIHAAQSYATASELLGLHEIDTLIVDAETGWPLAGAPLFEVARARNAEMLCIALLGAKPVERAAFGRRHGTDVVLDDTYPIKLVDALRSYLR